MPIHPLFHDGFHDKPLTAPQDQLLHWHLFRTIQYNAKHHKSFGLLLTAFLLIHLCNQLNFKPHMQNVLSIPPNPFPTNHRKMDFWLYYNELRL